MKITKENIKELVGRRFKHSKVNTWDAKIEKITKALVHYEYYNKNEISKEFTSIKNFIEWINNGSWVFIDESINQTEKEESETPNHYNNENGSLYLFAHKHGLNAWEFDVLKRTVRCRKKGEFESDIKKTIAVLELYLKEYEEKK